MTQLTQTTSRNNKPSHKPGYRVYEWEDETSMFDPKARYSYGCECYLRTYRCYVPVGLKEENFGEWYDKNQYDIVWINDDGIVAGSINDGEYHEWAREMEELA